MKTENCFDLSQIFRLLRMQHFRSYFRSRSCHISSLIFFFFFIYIQLACKFFNCLMKNARIVLFSIFLTQTAKTLHLLSVIRRFFEELSKLELNDGNKRILYRHFIINSSKAQLRAGLPGSRYDCSVANY